MAHLTVKPEATMATRAAALTAEIESIYSANHSYWKSGAIHSPAASADYDLRQLRKEILRELDEIVADSQCQARIRTMKPDTATSARRAV
jgi:hypothetical protein